MHLMIQFKGVFLTIKKGKKGCQLLKTANNVVLFLLILGSKVSSGTDIGLAGRETGDTTSQLQFLTMATSPPPPPSTSTRTSTSHEKTYIVSLMIIIQVESSLILAASWRKAVCIA